MNNYKKAKNELGALELIKEFYDTLNNDIEYYKQELSQAENQHIKELYEYEISMRQVTMEKLKKILD